MENRFQRDDLPNLEEVEQGHRQHIKWVLTTLNLVVVLFLLLCSALLFISAQSGGSVILGSRILIMEENKKPVLLMVRPDDRALDSKAEFLYTAEDGKLAVCIVSSVTDEIIQFTPVGSSETLSISKDDAAYSGKVVLQSEFLGSLCAPIAKRADSMVLYLLIAGLLLLSLLLLVLFYVIHQNRKAALVAINNEEIEEDADEDEDDEEEEDSMSALPFPLDRVIITPGRDGSPETVRLPEYVTSRMTELPLPRELDAIIEKYSVPPPPPFSPFASAPSSVMENSNSVSPSSKRPIGGNEESVLTPSKQDSDKKPTFGNSVGIGRGTGAGVGTKSFSELTMSDAVAGRLAEQKAARAKMGKTSPTSLTSLAQMGVTPAAVPPALKLPTVTTSLRAPVSLTTAKIRSAAQKAQQAYATPPTPEEAERLLEKELIGTRNILAEEDESEKVPAPQNRPFFSLTKPIPFNAFLPDTSEENSRTTRKNRTANIEVDKTDEENELDMEKLTSIIDSLYTGNIGGQEDDDEDMSDTASPTSPLGKLLSSRSNTNASANADTIEKEAPQMQPQHPITAETEEPSPPQALSFTEMLAQSTRSQFEMASSEVTQSADVPYERNSSPQETEAAEPPRRRSSSRRTSEQIEQIEPAEVIPPQRIEQVERVEPIEQAKPVLPVAPAPRPVEDEPDMAELLARRERRRAARTQLSQPQPQPSAPSPNEITQTTTKQEMAEVGEMAEIAPQVQQSEPPVSTASTAARSRADRLSRLERPSRSERTERLERRQSEREALTPSMTNSDFVSSASSVSPVSPIENANAPANDESVRTRRSPITGQPPNPVFDVRDDVPPDFVAELPGPERRRAAARKEREAGLVRAPAMLEPDEKGRALSPPPSTVPGSDDELVSELIRELWEKSEPQ